MNNYTPCIFSDSVRCKRMDCSGCLVKENILTDIPDNICRKCGADVDEYRKYFHKDHKCYVQEARV